MRIQSFDFSADVTLAILWQYNHAANITGLIEKKQDWYNTNFEQFFIDWYNNVFNLVTANFFGLSVWAYILNLPLFVPTEPDDPNRDLWGFNEIDGAFPNYINTYLNFENGNFAIQGNNITLTQDEQRFILRLRYFQLCSRGAIPEINSFLNYLCTDTPSLGGQIWALDGFDMTMTYVFNFTPSESLRAVLQLYDLLPRPAGVGIKYIILTDTIFGFEELFQNFENGNFIPESF